ncbi:ABC transporter permease [Sneathiella sp. HT1-7]|uniref:ABC transporter permease n=1 Tax=Sneathiella sp. HT1-7 TaxID=2887192 RepID=UPI001D13B0D1|nr:SMP-30/gluconolactonase/LRE family protein [Sneathiella sp. HT1-7]MCC3305151.1 SMP-30/gluconolactonase/LRE family protein [Sneathiella sp. HT1-7]
MSSITETIQKVRYKWSFQRAVAELLAKRWMESIIPFLMMCMVLIFCAVAIPGYLSFSNLSDTFSQFAEFGFVVLAMTLVLMVGGIDLSVGAMFALADFVALVLFNVFEIPVWGVIPLVILTGALMGAINGVLIGYLKLGAFLTTLVTLLLFRATFDLITPIYAVEIATGYQESEVWDFIGDGTLFGIPANIIILIIVAVIAHILLSRSRPGWHVAAIGSNRKAARHAGIRIDFTIFCTYVLSGILSATAGLVYATRLNSSSSNTGDGLEVMALTAAVLGGVSLAGGKGSVGRALIGATTILVLINGLVRLGVTGGPTLVMQGMIMLIAVGIDVKWLKNKNKAISKIYVVPAFLDLGERPDARINSHTVFEQNSKLNNARAIGLGTIDGPEDVILDRQNRLYAGTREGWIVRFSGDNHEHQEVFARIGGRPLGMAFDAEDNLIICIGGMGVYGVHPDGEVYKITDETNRTPWKINDDSRLRLADDLDIAPDGKIYFSEATIRYEMHSWAMDGLEGRGNGRLVCYDPAKKQTRTILRDLVFPNGVCIAHDGQSLFFAQTWACNIMQYWIAGPNKGKLEVAIENLPGNPDNINRASDGNYWLALTGMRTPAFDLAMKKPGFRTRMVKRVPPDEWIYSNINNGCVIKFSGDGEVLETYWDKGGESHPAITSMREHRGKLYLGGLMNNRIGVIDLPDADPNWTGPENYWGPK